MWLLCDHPLEEALKVRPLPGFGDLCPDLPGADFKGREQIQRAMPLISALQPAAYGGAVGFDVTGRSPDFLHARFFIHAQHHRVQRRVQV